MTDDAGNDRHSTWNVDGDEPPLSDQLLSLIEARPAGSPAEGRDCPFCGSPARLVSVCPPYFVACDACHAHGPCDEDGPGDDADAAIAAWNRRGGSMPPARTVRPIDRGHVPAAVRLDAVLERVEAAMALIRIADIAPDRWNVVEDIKVTLAEALAIGTGEMDPE